MRQRTQRGFTLIEMMIVVAIIGILATIAVFMFGKTSNSAKANTEVAGMFGELKIRQEQHHLENGSYLSTGTSDTDMWPSTLAGGGAKTELAPLPATWDDLRVAPDKTAVHCRYVTMAGTTDPSTGTATPSPGSTATSLGYVPPVGDWYYLIAECDMDGNAASNSLYFARSDQEGIFKRNEGH